MKLGYKLAIAALLLAGTIPAHAGESIPGIETKAPEVPGAPVSTTRSNKKHPGEAKEANSALQQVSTTRGKVVESTGDAMADVSTTRGKVVEGNVGALMQESTTRGKVVEVGKDPGPAGAPVNTSRSNKKAGVRNPQTGGVDLPSAPVSTSRSNKKAG